MGKTSSGQYEKRENEYNLVPSKYDTFQLIFYRIIYFEGSSVVFYVTD